MYFRCSQWSQRAETWCFSNMAKGKYVYMCTYQCWWLTKWQRIPFTKHQWPHRSTGHMRLPHSTKHTQFRWAIQGLQLGFVITCWSILTVLSCLTEKKLRKKRSQEKAYYIMLLAGYSEDTQYTCLLITSYTGLIFFFFKVLKKKKNLNFSQTGLH